MSAYYLDASAAVKPYSEERGADLVEELLNGVTAVYLSRVGIVEVVAAFFKKTRTGEMHVSEATSALEDFRVDLEDVYKIVEVDGATTETAIEVARDHRLRAYDCLQLATAILLQKERSRLGLEPLVMLSSDSELNEAAGREGLTVEDPALQASGANDADEEEEAEDGGGDEADEAEDADTE